MGDPISIFLEDMLAGFIRNPAAMHITSTVSDEEYHYEITTTDDHDKAILIGKRGVMSEAIRTICYAVFKKPSNDYDTTKRLRIFVSPK